MVFQDDGSRAFPTDTVRMGEQVLHQGCLAGQLKFDRTITKTVLAATGNGFVMLLNSVYCILHAHELDIAIIGFAGNAFHDDMNGLLAVVQDARVASKKGNNLSTPSRKRNLHKWEFFSLGLYS